MKKVILLSGSPNKNGNTMQVLSECKKTIEENNIEAEIISLAGYNLADFMNAKEAKEDGFEEILKKIRTSQGLIVAGPVYWGTVRAELMTAIQRIGMDSFKNGKYLSRMVGGPIAIARRGGLTSSLQEMLMMMLANDMIIPGSTYWNIVFAQKPGEAEKDIEGINTVKRFSENVAYLVEKIDK